MYSGGFNGFGFFVFLGVSFGINQKKANFSIKIIKKTKYQLVFSQAFLYNLFKHSLIFNNIHRKYKTYDFRV